MWVTWCHILYIWYTEYDIPHVRMQYLVWIRIIKQCIVSSSKFELWPIVYGFSWPLFKNEGCMKKQNNPSGWQNYCLANDTSNWWPIISCIQRVAWNPLVLILRVSSGKLSFWQTAKENDDETSFGEIEPGTYQKQFICGYETRYS